MIPVAIGEIERLEELAAKPAGRARQDVDRQARGIRAGLGAQRREVDERAGGFERDLLMIGRDARHAVIVEQRPDFREAPSQRGAGIVGAVPQQLAQVRARMRSCAAREVCDEGARLLRWRQGQGTAVA